MATFCLGCLNPLPDGDDVCRVCGFTADSKNPAIALPIGSVLQDHYVVGRMVREAGDSLSYLAYDKTLGEPCFIQEYYPGGLCARTADNALVPLGGCDALYADYQQSFTKLMRSLARVKDLPCVIPIYDIFEENGTVYAISDYIAGETLARRLERIGRVSWQGSRTLFMSLLTCLEQLASAGISHNAICPANIVIGNNGKPYLRSYSIADTRQVGHDLTPRLATGYAAPEQYMLDAPLNEATDVYGLAATIFRTVTGTVPPAGNTRADDSDDLFMTAEIADELTQQVCVALFNALQKSADSRTATIKQLHQQLAMEPNVSALLNEDKPAPEKKKMKPALTLLIIFGSVTAALLLIIGIVWYLIGLGGEDDTTSDPSPTLPSVSTTTTTAPLAPSAQEYSVPNLVGKLHYNVKDELKDGSFSIEVRRQACDEDVKEDEIYKQEPAAGTALAEGSTIVVYVSNHITVPDVSGLTKEKATEWLTSKGFIVEVANRIGVSSTPVGQVINTEPAANEKALPGDKIILNVSASASDADPNEPAAQDPNNTTPADTIS